MTDFIRNVCDVCHKMLRYHEGYYWYGTYDLTFNHHYTWQDLKKSKDESCCICRAIFERIDSDDSLSLIAKGQNSPPATDEPNPEINVPKPLSVPLLRAGLYLVKNPQELEDLKGPDNPEDINSHAKERLYCVIFTLRGSNQVGSFVLKPGSYDQNRILDTQVPNSTGSEEVFKTARDWLEKCKTHSKCQNIRPSDARHPYPTRLIDLSTFGQGFVRLVVTRRRRPFDGQYWRSNARSLISYLLRKDGSRLKAKGEYMTLSHRWGEADPLKLTWSNMKKFLWSGIPVEDLPKTFQDAMKFAKYLGIQYLWIDSLCIAQLDKEAGKHKTEAMQLHEMDWKEESKHMMEVYGGSYLNISATHGGNCASGLFRDRTADRWWTGYAPIWVHKVPGVHMEGDQSMYGMPGEHPPPEKCQVQDWTFWDVYVRDSALNRRAWVLQERLMAPRVIHFCKDQIAWECCELNAAESLPGGVPTHSGKLKGLDSKKDGFSLYRKRVAAEGEFSEEDQTVLGALEIWRRVVETYSGTELTLLSDRLIALSGIAKNLYPQIGSDYLAGLWSKNLAGQLLWYVEPEFKRDIHSWKAPGDAEGTFCYPGKRPGMAKGKYLAPTWSWASVHVENHVGIVYGAITLRDSWIKIKDGSWRIESQEGSDNFGLLQTASIQVTGKLKTVEVVWEERNGNTRFHWKPIDDERRKAVKDTYWNVYLDCYKDDLDERVQGQIAECFPVGTDEEGYFCCLLLKDVDRKQHFYKRIGLIRNPDFDPSGKKALEKALEGGSERTITIF